MKILIIGACGMLGNTLIKHFTKQKQFNIEFSVRDQSRQHLCQKLFKKKAKYLIDAQNPITAKLAINDFKPNICINCIGLIKQKSILNNHINSIEINSLFPHYLYGYCQEIFCRLIQVSTDCVFSGLKGNYTENDIPDPIDLYGYSKLLGEIKQENAVTIRTSIIGHEVNSKFGLLEWFLNENNKINGYNNAYFSGLTTLELSTIIAEFIIPKINLKGIYHISSKPINKFDLLNLINNIYCLEKIIYKDESISINRSLDSTKFKELSGYKFDNWVSMIKRMKRFHYD